MFALVDCNNFYASCERLFRPELIGKPIVVLSNNDGCVIARSNEAKAFGIVMGAPAFKMEKEMKQNGIHVFSSNYTLYGDISNRVMTELSGFTPDIETYSIDEAFLSLHGMPLGALEMYGREIVRAIHRNVGIPVSVGIAPTKVLAKVANKIAKKNPSKRGACLLDTWEKQIEVLSKFAVEDVWGIGRQHTKRLNAQGVKTALDFMRLPRALVQKQFTIVGLKIWEELHGVPRIELEDVPAAKQTICTARSFGKMIGTVEQLTEALSNYAATCAAKLRRQKCCASCVTVFLHTNPFREDLPQYARSAVANLHQATSSTIELIEVSAKMLSQIYKAGFLYKKIGIILSEIVPENEVQVSLFDTIDRPRDAEIMGALDSINAKYGRDALRIGRQGFGKRWKHRQERLSPCYSTRLSDVLTIKV